MKYLNVPGNNLPAEQMRPGYPPMLPVSALPHGDPGDLNIAKYLSILRKNLWVIVGIVMCSTLVAVLISMRSPKIYEAVTKINVERETPQVVNFKEVINDSFDYEMFIETQMRILQSNRLAWRTINDLKLPYDPGFVGKQAQPRRPDSRPLSDAEQYSLTGRFLGNLRIVRVRGSQLVEVHFFCFDPQLAARVANQLTENFINQNLKGKYEATVKATEWLETQLDELRAKVEKSEEELVAYERANSILILDDKADRSVTLDKMSDVNKQLTMAESDRRGAEAKWKVLQQQGPNGLVQVSGSALLSNLQSKLNDLNQTLAEYSEQYDVNHPKYQRAKSQRDQAIVDLDREIKKAMAQIEADYRVTMEREQSVRKAFGEVKVDMENQNNKYIQYNILKRDVEANRSLYNGLLTRLKEARVSAGLNFSNIAVVDLAQAPLAPTLPRTGQNISLGVIVGVLLGLAASFLRDFMDNTVKTPDDVEQFAQLPNLGVIPGISPGLVRAAYYAGYGLGKSKNKQLAPGQTESTQERDSKAIVGLCRPETVTLSHPHSSIAESFRALRTALLLANSGMPPRTILVTSGLPSEGKTTIAINVAITLAQRGGRVLLVDADLRRPSVHRHLADSRKVRDESVGLSHYLTGNCQLSEAIQSSGLISNLDLMMAGSIPPNPAELCSSEPMRKLLHELREEYSHVIIDSPPLLSVTDSTILSVQTDGVLLVSRSGFSTRDSLRRAKRLLEHVNSRLLGVVLNDLNLAVDGYYYYYYYGYYGYGRPDREVSNAVGR